VEVIDGAEAAVGEVGEEAAQIDAAVVAQGAVEASAEAVAGAVIEVLAEVGIVHQGRRHRGVGVRNGLEVVDAASVSVERAAEDGAPLLMTAPTPSGGAADLAGVAGIVNRGEAAVGVDGKDGGAAGNLGDQVDRASDGVTALVGFESLVELDRTHKVGGDDVEFHLPDAAFRRLELDAVHGDVAETGLGAADLEVFAFAFIALEGDAGEA